MIEFNNVSKTFTNGTHALKNVNIKINQGDFVFVVGASGAGKSTFLKLMMREEVPSSGSIMINNYKLCELENKEIPYFRRTLGVVFQDFRLIPNMTVYDNIAFAMRVIGAREKKIRKRVPYVISLVGLAAKARSYPSELSGGEQQRVALARALANNAELIIADEPTGNVDPQMSYEIVDLLTRLNDAGTTVVMVTHEHNLVRRFNRRVIILEHGCVVYDGESLNTKNVRSSQGHIRHDIMPPKGDNANIYSAALNPKEKKEGFKLHETATVTLEGAGDAE
ncbi:MAG: cell division ATP-binding protein FtsE [Clostridiales bacterium]|nr:cell division ATP-binding protein FtsE [Clostridiales bacterium]